MCSNCHAQLDPGTKFCIYCGTKVTNPTYSATTAAFNASGVEVVKNKVQWNIQPGVIAQRISPADFENLDNVTGIIIQQGVTARIYIDGQPVAQLKGGMYDFISRTDIDNLLNEKSCQGLFGNIRKVLNSLVKVITGKKVKEVIEEKQHDNSGIKTYDDVLRRLKPQSNIDVYLISDQPFNVIFGASVNTAGDIEFAPMKVRCRHLTADVALTMEMKITDIDMLLSTFLIHNNIVTCGNVAHYMAPLVKSIVTNQLRDITIDEYGIPTSVSEAISRALITNVRVPGTSINQIREITSSNAAFDRLRAVADELYISEKELEIAIRTNEFQNRLAGVENEKQINKARTALDLHKTLSDINKDKILHEDEVDEFYMLLSRQKKIREATSEHEVRAALNDIARLDMIKDDEMDALRDELLEKKADRSSIVELMILQRAANAEQKRLKIEQTLANDRHILDKANLAHSQELEIEKLKGDLNIDTLVNEHTRHTAINDKLTETELQKIDLGQKKLSDEYSDDRFYSDLKKQRDIADLNISFEERKRRLDVEEMERLNRQNMDMFTMWAEEDERKAQNDHLRKIEEKTVDYGHEISLTQAMNAHQEEQSRIEIEKRRISATMSSDQLIAEQAAKLDAEAQRHLTDAYGNAKVSEAENKMRERQIEDARIREAQMRVDAEARERAIREDNQRFFSHLSSDRDNMLNTMKDIVGTMAGVTNKVNQYSNDNNNLKNRLVDSERHISYREEEIGRLNDRLRHEEDRNDRTYDRVLDHEEKLQNTTVDAIKATHQQLHVDNPQIQTIICPNCKQNVIKAKFCKNCGSELFIK